MSQSTKNNGQSKHDKRHPTNSATQEKTSTDSVPVSAVFVFCVQSLTLILSFIPYLRLHEINILEILFAGGPRERIKVELIGNDISLGSMIEAVFWSGIAVCVRGIMFTGSSARRKEINATRHLMEWTADLLSTPLLTAVVVSVLRSPRITFGRDISLSLATAGLGVYASIGFLLGFFGSTQRILTSIFKGTIGHYSAFHHLETDNASSVKKS